MVSFDWPLVFLALPLPLLLVRGGLPATGDRTVGVMVPPELAEALGQAGGRSPGRPGARIALCWLAWLLLLAAAAQPSIVAGEAVQPASGRAIVLALDLSSSMERRDFVLDGQAVDRLTALKSVAADFVAKREGDRLGLVLFGEEAFTAAPVSFDLAAIANAVSEAEIGMAGRSTAIGEALGLSVVMLREDPAAEKTIILLSDGTNNSGSAEPEDAARLAAGLDIRIHTIGMASAQADAAGGPLDPSADLDEATLRTIASEGKGKFYRVRTTDELRAVYGDLDRIEASEAEAPPFIPRADVRNIVLAALCLVLAALALMAMRPGLRS